MLSWWTFILVGQNNTGKTTFQRRVVEQLCIKRIVRLQSNALFEITHPEAAKELKRLFVMNRSFQERADTYRTIEGYFKKFFERAEICILSSHPDKSDIEKMIYECQRRQYNVAGVFWSNSFVGNTSKMLDDLSSTLNWDERVWFENPRTSSKEKQDEQIRKLADRFSAFICKRSHAN